MIPSNLTHIERKLYDALADGKPHKPDELIPLLTDLSDRSDLQYHMTKLRQKLYTVGEDVVAQSFGKWIGYRRVRKLIVTTGE